MRCVFAFVLIGLLHDSYAQKPENLGNIRTISVASLGDDASARAVRQRIVEHLGRSGRTKVVKDPAAADAVLRGTANVWVTGTVVIDPRSNSSRLTNYQGYVSMELVGKENHSLWSYLVTPSRFRTGSIISDLGDHAASRLLNAIESGAVGSSAPVPISGSATHVSLHASGSTLAAPMYLKWFESSGIPVTYDAIGSEAGIQQLTEGKIDFAASDMPLPGESSGTLHVTQLPTVLGGVVPIYNVPELRQDLYLTPEVLAGIYSGRIRKWNNPALRQSNPGAHLPNADIAVVHRSDGSGTTYVWTSFLSLVSPEWKKSVGAGTHVTWPAGTGARGNEGVAQLVQKTTHAIGYVELSYAIQHHLEFAAVRNPAGRFIKADLASITAAAAGATAPGNGRFPLSILNAPSKAAYPISTFTWLLVPKTGLDPEKKAVIADLLNWMLTRGQKQCASLGYPPLPHEVAARALHAVDAMKSPSD